jgi:hypothetical protein
MAEVDGVGYERLAQAEWKRHVMMLSLHPADKAVEACGKRPKPIAAKAGSVSLS